MARKNRPLPIGSVVLLKGADTKMMILGYLKYGPFNRTDIYDYAACLYPQGYHSPEKTFVFNHDGIERIYALGYQDDSQIEFAEELMEQFRSIKGETDFS
ncbi:MAG TPA: DUF4176 domain-containing protein [Candidatus Lachnoclostridium stercoravium]|uniref:DUF4176 domain-containing protein n=1 Tax=Candidatus Lachnoclostridium stercoravium TaxID=2838633 RepID=A0A9D2HGM2_9FIRM|nr:DUF4176 domain-containing protein [Candidatus Lachnoclostridium stercoravium]